MTEAPELTNGKFDEFIQEGVALVDFYAEWCMPCLMMGPVIDDLAEKFKGKIKIGKINIEENRDIANKYNVSSIPNFILFKDGEVIDQFVGALSAEEFEEKLKAHI